MISKSFLTFSLLFSRKLEIILVYPETIIKILVRREVGRGYSYFHLIICLCIYVCHATWPNQIRYRPQIWYTYSHRPYLKMVFFCFCEKMTLRAASLENCRVTWIFCISPQLPCYISY